MDASANVAKELRDNCNLLLQRWEEQAREEVIAARETDSLALRDHLPYILTEIQEALSRLPSCGSGREAGAKSSTARHSAEHGRHRASTPGYTVDQVIHEYIILRRVLIDHLLGEGLCERDHIEAITSVLEQGSLTAVSEFVNSIERFQNTMLGTLAHDIRTPLSVAKSALTLLIEQGNDFDQSDEMKDMALQGIDRALTMLGGMLDALVAEAGDGIALTFEEGDFTVGIRKSCEEAQRSYAKRLEMDLPTHQIMGVFDGAALRRIFENLVSNAIRYGSKEHPVRVALEDKGDSIALTVNNQGDVIEEAQRSKIFEFLSPHYKAPTDGSQRYGMGLAYVKLAAEGHRGEVTLDSNADEGTTFRVILPKFPRKPGRTRTRVLKQP